MSTVPMRAIIAVYHPGEGRHWFDDDTMKFFGTKLPQYGYHGPGGTYFVTSEKPPHGTRMYSVRQLVGPGDLDTIGEFCSMTSAAARILARRCAAIGSELALAGRG